MIAEPSPYRDELEEILHRLRHDLPSQAPLKDFIHHNTLHAFQHLPFDRALRVAGSLYGARTHLALREYEPFLRDGRIRPEILESLRHSVPGASGLSAEAIRDLVRRDLAQPAPRPAPAPGVRDGWSAVLGSALEDRVRPILFRLASQFLDQGISAWPMPGAATDSFYECVQKLFLQRGPALPPLTDAAAQALLALDARPALERCLGRLVAQGSSREAYLRAMLLAHPGWSGLVAAIEEAPASLPKPRRISLLEFCALKAILEVGTLSAELGPDFPPLAFTETRREAPDSPPARVLQLALEESYYHSLLTTIATRPELPPEIPVAPSLQAVFCLDDRECSLRRHLEAELPGTRTYGAAGFFGIDTLVLREGELRPYKSCPVPVRPRHVVGVDAGDEYPRHEREKHFRRIRSLHGSVSKRLLHGLITTPWLGVVSSLRLLLDVFNPSAHERAFGLDRLRADGRVRYEAGDAPEGYTEAEMAARVAGLLRQIGLTDRFAPVVLIIGHASSSANNPYYAAYDCGACSGRPGATNARVFSAMANRPGVRELLQREYGITIPPATRFIGGLHDTCKDVVTFYDHEAPGEVQEGMQRALGRNAIERCRRFELAPAAALSEPRPALHHVRERSLAIFEPRPELNHANNASCIVGRRRLTEGLTFDRRAFLQSYDPTTDPTGKTLQGILNAVVPVCGGINLEYYFSRIDPEVYGSGTKLSHNVNGLLAVVNGAEGDVLTGLPTQMTEMHDPVRLMIVIEQDTDIIERVLRETPAVNEWIVNEWVRLAAVNPRDPSDIRRWDAGRFERIGAGGAP